MGRRADSLYREYPAVGEMLMNAREREVELLSTSAPADSVAEALLGLRRLMQDGQTRSRRLRVESDDLLDDEIQLLTRQHLEASSAAALHAVQRVQQSVVALPLFGRLLGAVASLLIARSVVGPVRSLIEGVTRIGGGELHHRVPIHSADELGALAAAFNRMAEQRQQAEAELVRSNAELESFAYLASHDLQEPLRKIQAFGDRLRTRYAEQLGEQGAGYPERMRGAGARMQGLIKDLLAFSRIRTRGQAFAPVDLGAVVREVASDLEVRIHVSGARLEIGELPVIEADALQVRQLFQNLIGNALQFRRSGVAPVVHVYCAPQEPAGAAHRREAADPRVCRIVVEDNGIGFEQQYAVRIFLPCQRLHGRAEDEGTGIGPGICAKVVARHEGRITAWSEPGEGARFEIDLPLPRTAVVADERVCAIAAGGADPSTSSGSSIV